MEWRYEGKMKKVDRRKVRRVKEMEDRGGNEEMETMKVKEMEYTGKNEGMETMKVKETENRGEMKEWKL